MPDTRTYADLYADITDVTARMLLPGDDDYGRLFVEKSRRLADLWGEVAELSYNDKLPATACLSARLLADRYAADAERHHH